MPDYQRGKIYKIISPHTDKCYVGSTTLKYLSRRLCNHVQTFKRGVYLTSSEIMKLGDYEIVLLELYPCNSKDELHARERHYIEKLDCVNKSIPFRSKEEKIQHKIKYNEDSKELIYKTKHDYYIKNKESISLKNKEYRLKTKEKCNEYNKEYRLKNKDKIKEYNKVKINCECGCLINKTNISAHKKTKKHLDLIQSSL